MRPSSGSNYGPTDARLIERVSGAVAESGAAFPVPADAVTTSGSGLDPHISPGNARMQVARIARARGQDASEIQCLLNTMTELPLLGIGEPRVNVLALNLALAAMAQPAR